MVDLPSSTKILPLHLSSKENLLLLSQWICIRRDDFHIRHATNSWLSSNKVNVTLGSDCDLSPHRGHEIPLNVSAPYIDMLLGPQKPARSQPKQSSEQKELTALPSPGEVLVTLRLTVDSGSPSDVSTLIRFCSVELLSAAGIITFGSKQYVTALMISHSVSPIANFLGLCA